MTSRETTVLRAIAKALRPNGDQSEMFTFAVLYLPRTALVSAESRGRSAARLETAALLLDFVASGSVD